MPMLRQPDGRKATMATPNEEARTLDSGLDSILDFCRDVAQDIEFPEVQNWLAKQPGRKAIGCFPIYCPVELIHAAGMVPLGVIGGGNEIEIAHADSRFQSFVCSIVKSTLELGLTKRLEFLDGMLFHSICDPARNLASVFIRNFPGMFVEYTPSPQTLVPPPGKKYWKREYRGAPTGREGRAGRPVTPAD